MPESRGGYQIGERHPTRPGEYWNGTQWVKGKGADGVTTTTPVTSDPHEEAAKFKARHQAEAIESKKHVTPASPGPAPSSVISPLGAAAEEAAKRRKKKTE